MDFIRVAYKELKDGTREFYPSLQATESQDLVIRGNQFVAIWDEQTGLYSRQQSLVPDIVDRAFSRMVEDRLRPGDVVKKMRVFENQLFSRLIALIRSIGDMGPELDQKIVFYDQTPTKLDAATFKMPYSLTDAQCPVWEEIVSTLYEPEERVKIEWAIGSIFNGAAANEIQKFYVFFGPPGSGKSTIMNIIEQLFDGHTASFSAFDLGKADSQFSLEPFARNPLVAIDQDGDLSRIEVNKDLNSIVSHDRVLINSKGKNLFPIIPRSTLFIGSNDPVKISNRKSGLFRRLVDIQPSGRIIPEEHYHRLMDQVMFELGAIAQHCIGVFEGLGKTYLSSYRSHDMMYRTNDIFNFVQDHRLVLEHNITLKQASKLYKEWCEETDTKNVYKQFQFRDLLKDYFQEFHEEIMIDGTRMRSYFMGLRELEKFSWKGTAPVPPRSWLELDSQASILDELLKDEKAQYSTGDARYPLKQAWENVTTTLKDLDTAEEHYVKVPTQHIVIDFDLKDDHGTKSIQRNLDAASHWPPTYAEVSRGGGGLHLHYEYAGDPAGLATHGDDGSYEIKTLLDGASLRRKLSLCNALEVATISSGLPLKEEKEVLTEKTMSSEKTMRALIVRALKKDITYGTKQNMDFIKKVFTDAEKQGMAYDLTDMWDDILAFAMGSSNQRAVCIDIAMGLKLKSETELIPDASDDEKPIVFYDCEVYPNMFAIGWMYDRDDAPVVKMLNPTPQEVEDFFIKFRTIGYNNRGYDNHILWARTLGYTNAELFQLSQRIVSNDRRALFGAAYNVHYADVFDFASEKRTLKWWQIKLGLPHKEMDLPWDQPVPDDRVEDVLAYLENDVRSTRAVAKHRQADFDARKILADLTDMEPCNTTRQLTERLIFDDLPWDTTPELVYTDLREMFPGYEFDQFAPGKEKSKYRGYDVGEGGWVYSEPGMYENVVLLDVASMHPTSIVELNMFGKFTARFKELMDVRLAIKKADYNKAGEAFNGKLKPYLTNKDNAKALSNALKIVINSVYGLTAASFPNKFKDPRNIDNIVAKRGALFMVDLKEYVEGLIKDGEIPSDCRVVHIKTDSIKIAYPSRPDMIPAITELVSDFGQKYGYTFEHEATYDKFCLVNDAVYIARYGWAEDESKIGTWEAVGAQFQHPVVFKTLFSKEEFVPGDYVETKQVTKAAMYLEDVETGVRQFVGRFGAFVPVLGGRRLLRIDGDKVGAVGGTKDHLWEIDEVAATEDMEVDFSYFQALVEAAAAQINKYGPIEQFLE